ncbi:MAG TPA: response regulator [Nitrososphaeraceae archaeon]|nr:response regulator [Nitrososphaeraceae archaeon]
MISNNKGKEILLVDDEPDVTYTIKNILEDNEYNVDSFNDPILALNYYKVNFYALVILDIKMPKMDGFELYNKIREKDPKVKICFLTASEMYYEKFRKVRSEIGRIIGEDSFIQKPIKNEDLMKKLTDIMNSDITTMLV